MLACLRFGNVLLMIQPPRGFGENPVAIYHDPDLPASHHYLAGYRWLEHGFGAVSMDELAEAAGVARRTLYNQFTSKEDILREMLLIRRFEEKVEERFRAGELPGFLHVAIGQEACAVGVCRALGDGDVIASTHRAHGHTPTTLGRWEIGRAHV